jgi:chromosome segregation ATPase
MTASPMQAVEALVTNVRNLASNDGYKAIASVFDEIPQLNAQIESQDAELNRLRVNIKALETTHESRIQEDLEIYCKQRNKLEEEKGQLSKDISTLTTKVQQRDAAAIENQRIQDTLRGQLDLAKKSLDEEKKKVIAANAATTRLQESLRGKDTGIDKLKETLQNEKVQVAKVKSQLQDLLKEKSALQKECQSCMTKLSEIEQFTTKLHEEDEEVW